MMKFLEQLCKDIIVWPMTNLSAWSILSVIGIHGCLAIIVFLVSLAIPLVKPLAWVLVSMTIFMYVLMILFIIGSYLGQTTRKDDDE